MGYRSLRIALARVSHRSFDAISSARSSVASLEYKAKKNELPLIEGLSMMRQKENSNDYLNEAINSEPNSACDYFLISQN